MGFLNIKTCANPAVFEGECSSFRCPFDSSVYKNTIDDAFEKRFEYPHMLIEITAECISNHYSTRHFLLVFIRFSSQLD